MGSRRGDQDTDGIIWTTANLRLGGTGLDLRRPSDPPQLATLLNARFLDERTLERRAGHDVTVAQDASAFPTVGSSITGGNWVYGHGIRTLQTGNPVVPGLTEEDQHVPIAGRGGLVFDHGDNHIVWTGDRLLAMRDGGNALGGSQFWYRNTLTPFGINVDQTHPLAQGIPAYLPLQTDSNPPNLVHSGWVNTCLTSTLRVTVDIDEEQTGVRAWITDRVTGAVIDYSEISGASNAPAEVKVVNSGDIPVAVWYDASLTNLYISHWSGTAWTTAAVIVTSVASWDLAAVDGGFHLIFRTGGTVKAIHYSGFTSQVTPYDALTVFDTSTFTPNGQVAVGVGPDGSVCLAWEASTGLYAQVYTNLLANSPLAGVQHLSTLTPNAGNSYSVCSRGLISDGGGYDWLIHGMHDAIVDIWCFRTGTNGSWLSKTTRFNSSLASKSFRVGNEIFAWLRADNSKTDYLLAGFNVGQVCGFADREEAAGYDTRTQYGVPTVLPDPLSSSRYTWMRQVARQINYARAGNARVGDLEFLPTPTSARFGHCTYLSGSAVRAWDGVSLNDAGWQDFPTVKSFAQATGGPLTLLSTYNWRVYAVRYNATGERIESAAVTSGTTLTGSNNKLTATINTVPATNHNDVVLEIYRTEANGTTFFLEGTVANSLTAATVTFASVLTDALLIAQPEDSHATGVGNPAELESFGPLGCSLLVTAGDRLWGAGGQVEAGSAQFSKLWDEGFAAGFDDLAGTQVIDIEGGAVTSIASFNDAIVFFEANKLAATGGTGPDNFGNGVFETPEIRLADGAITHAGTVQVPAGLLYWGVDGPRILEANFTSDNICAPVRPLTKDVTPVGVRVDFARQEVIWFTTDGDALLWNFRVAPGRWAQWTGLPAVSVSHTAHLTGDGRLYVYDESALGDGGVLYPFTVSSGDVRPEDLLTGATKLRRIGLTGAFLGDHSLRFRVFYNGSPLWAEETVWEPTVKTWLSSGDSVSTLTPAQVDAIGPLDHSGAYATHKRVSRETCRYFRVEFSDMGSYTPTLTPFELVFELGAEPGLGRVPVNTFADS